jgi:hypothetical protein
LDIVAGVRKSLDRRDVLAIAVLVLIGVGIPLWLAAAAGAIGIPTVDDWVYTQGADSLFRIGIVTLPGHTTAAIGQLLLVQPLLWLSKGEPWAYTVFGLVMVGVTIVFTFLLARRFLERPAAIFTVGLLLAFPGLEREGASFMTDVPAFGLSVMCLWLGTKWLQGQGGRAVLVGSIAIGILALSIREFAVAAPLAVAVTAWIRGTRRDRIWLTGLLVVLLAAIAGVLAIAGSANRFVPGPPRGSLALSVAIIGGAFATINAVLLPLIIAAARSRIWSLTPRELVTASIVGLLVVLSPTGVLIGNYWTVNGIGSDLLLAGTRELVFGGRIWALFEQLAILSTVLLVAMFLGFAARNDLRVRGLAATPARAFGAILSWHAPLPLFLALYAAELIAYTPFGPILDRYLFPIVPAAAILLLRGSKRPLQMGRGLALSHAAFAWIAISALVLAANSFAYDAARWREGQAAVLAGYDAKTVDAGYEWVGYHATARSTPGESNYILPWYYGAISANPPCIVISSSRLEGGLLTLLGETPSAYLNYLFVGPPEPLYTYAALRDGCPPPVVLN